MAISSRADSVRTTSAHALTLAEAVEIEMPFATLAERRTLMPEFCQEWHQTCSHIEDRLAFLARHAAGRCPV